MKYYQKLKQSENGIDLYYSFDNKDNLDIIKNVPERILRCALGRDYDYLFSKNLKKYGLEYCFAMKDQDYKDFKKYSQD